MSRKRKRPRRPLTDQQKEAARLIFETGRIGATAAAVGVHRTTIWRWYKRKDFQREIDRAHDKWQREYRREVLREMRKSPEHKRKLAARRRLKRLELKLSEAGNSGDMRAYRQAEKAYNECFNEAYLGGRSLFSFFNSSPTLREPQKRPEPKKYIVEIID